MLIKKIMCKLYRLLIYVFKEIPVLFLLEIWTVARVLTILLVVVYIIVGNIWSNNVDVNILKILK